MPEYPILHTFNLFGFDLQLRASILYQWLVMVIIIATVLFIRARKFETVPKGVQNTVEAVVGTIYAVVEDTMGKKYRSFAPYMGTIIIFLLLLNWSGLLGIEPPTADYSVALGFALTTFVIINVNAVAKNGLGHYFKAFAQPVPFLLPLNIIERLTVPVSLSLRLFGNITAAAVMMKLLYTFFGFVSKVAYIRPAIGEHITFPFLQIALPIPFHLYFDLFDGTIQMIIFLMLTMVFIKTTAEH